MDDSNNLCCSNKLEDPNKVNTQSFNSSISNYDKYYLTPAEQELVSTRFKGRILDMGCGCGRTTVPLHEKGFDVVGFDIAQDMINFAHAKFPNIPFHVMDASNLEFPDNSFDTLFFSYCGIDYLHPFQKRIACLNECFRVLKRGGVLIYSSHNSLALPNYCKNLQRIRTTILNLAKIFRKGYRLESTNNKKLITYYASPAENIYCLKQVGFINAGVARKNSFKETWLNSKPYYVAWKPA
ncbi:MAG: methyltransferase domain-containing protein [Candidatus Woesearchaeota archaeon]|nr:methyltransferase domain-containing protein [Candidatus Woesearchaeota archaeon]